MKFLIDNNLSPSLADRLRNAGYDAVHVQHYKMGAVKDELIFTRATQEDRVIVSADTDFGEILARQRTTKPSVILFRWPLLRRSSDQLIVILANLPNISADLEQGSIVVIEESRIRVRRLPLGEGNVEST